MRSRPLRRHPGWWRRLAVPVPCETESRETILADRLLETAPFRVGDPLRDLNRSACCAAWVSGDEFGGVRLARRALPCPSPAPCGSLPGLARLFDGAGLLRRGTSGPDCSGGCVMQCVCVHAPGGTEEAGLLRRRSAHAAAGWRHAVSRAIRPCVTSSCRRSAWPCPCGCAHWCACAGHGPEGPCDGAGRGSRPGPSGA